MSESNFMEMIKRKRQITKEHPEYDGKLYCLQDKSIFNTSNLDYHIYLRLE